jgi:precorrin-6Y C5,15-methyltransferase (decarboxylating)
VTVSDAAAASPTVVVVGIGADGWAGLADPARELLRHAEVLLGSVRQLDLVPEASGERIAWPSPLLPALPGMLDEHAGRAICVLASGDPLFFGIGATLIRLLGPDRVRVLPHPSSVSLACARLGWPYQDVEVVSLVGRPIDHLRRAIPIDGCSCSAPTLRLPPPWRTC